LYGMDVSNYQGDISAILDRHKPEFLIVRASTETAAKRAIAQDQMRKGHARGIPIDIYVWCYWGLDPEAHTRDALAVADGSGVPYTRAWPDVEDRDGSRGPSGNIEWLGAAIRVIEMSGKEAGIYTSPGLWAELCGGSGDCAYLPLWHANPDGDRTLGFGAGEYPYGGWQKVAIKQWKWESNLDFNVADSSLWAAAPPDDELARLREQVFGLRVLADDVAIGRLGEQLDRQEAAGVSIPELRAIRDECKRIRVQYLGDE
jgi:hypothetical protein